MRILSQLTSHYVVLCLISTYVNCTRHIFASPISSPSVEITLNVFVPCEPNENSVTIILNCNGNIHTRVVECEVPVTQFNLTTFPECENVLHGSSGAVVSSVKLDKKMMILIKTAHLDNVNMMMVLRGHLNGEKYYVNTFCPWVASICVVTVVAHEDCTVNVTFPPHVSKKDLVLIKPNVFVSATGVRVSLMKYQVLRIESKADLTGTYLTGTANMTVFSGARNVSGIGGKMYHYFEQLLPLIFWQNEYIILPRFDCETNKAADIIRIVSSKPETNVQITRCRRFKIPYAGHYVQWRINNRLVTRVSADKPILVMQYIGLTIYNCADTYLTFTPMMKMAFAPRYTYNNRFRTLVVKRLCPENYSLSVIANANSGWNSIPGSNLTAKYVTGTEGIVPKELNESIAGFLNCKSAEDEWSVIFDYTDVDLNDLTPNATFDKDCAGSDDGYDYEREELVGRVNASQYVPLRYPNTSGLNGLQSITIRIIHFCGFASLIFQRSKKPTLMNWTSDYFVLNTYPDMIGFYKNSILLKATSHNAKNCSVSTREYILSWGQLGTSLYYRVSLEDPLLSLILDPNIINPELRHLEIISFNGDIELEIWKSNTSAVPSNCYTTVHTVQKRSVLSAFPGDIPIPSPTELTDENNLYELEADDSPIFSPNEGVDVKLDDLYDSKHNLHRRSATNQTTTTNTSSKCTRIYRCPCGWDITQNLTKEEIDKKAEELVQKLTINRTTLGATIRAKTSTVNKRLSERILGMAVGLFFCVFIVVIIVVLDLPSLIHAFHDFRRGLWDCWHA